MSTQVHEDPVLDRSALDANRESPEISLAAALRPNPVGTQPGHTCSVGGFKRHSEPLF